MSDADTRGYVSLDARAQPALFARFLQQCVLVGLEGDELAQIARETVRDLSRAISARESTHVRALEAHWYAQLAAGAPDFTIYKQPAYLAELWACWRVYSREYLRALTKPSGYLTGGVLRALEPRTIVDVGCGLGYTSAMFCELCPDAHVVATNLTDTPQWNVARLVADDYGFALVENVADLPRNADVLFASEYFEHFPDPIHHAAELIAQCRPRVLIVANSFNAHSIGHFATFSDAGARVKSAQMGRRFNTALRDTGYRAMATHFWNNRPTCWIRD